MDRLQARQRPLTGPSNRFCRGLRPWQYAGRKCSVIAPSATRFNRWLRALWLGRRLRTMVVISPASSSGASASRTAHRPSLPPPPPSFAGWRRMSLQLTALRLGRCSRICRLSIACTAIWNTTSRHWDTWCSSFAVAWLIGRLTRGVARVVCTYRPTWSSGCCCGHLAARWDSCALMLLWRGASALPSQSCCPTASSCAAVLERRCWMRMCAGAPPASPSPHHAGPREG